MPLTTEFQKPFFNISPSIARTRARFLGGELASLKISPEHSIYAAILLVKKAFFLPMSSNNRNDFLTSNFTREVMGGEGFTWGGVDPLKPTNELITRLKFELKYFGPVIFCRLFYGNQNPSTSVICSVLDDGRAEGVDPVDGFRFSLQLDSVPGHRSWLRLAAPYVKETGYFMADDMTGSKASAASLTRSNSLPALNSDWPQWGGPPNFLNNQQANAWPVWMPHVPQAWLDQ